MTKPVRDLSFSLVPCAKRSDGPTGHKEPQGRPPLLGGGVFLSLMVALVQPGYVLQRGGHCRAPPWTPQVRVAGPPDPQK